VTTPKTRARILAYREHYNKNASQEKGYKVLPLYFLFFCILTTTSPTFSQAPQEQYATLLLDVNGYVSFKDSYKINYETNTFGLPVEYGIGLLFPASTRLSAGVLLHYKSRDAIFVNEMSISSFEIVPTVQYYLDEPVPKELHLYGRAGIGFIRSTAEGVIQATTDGTNVSSLKVSRPYYNIGIALGLGIVYPIGSLSGITAGLDVRTYFADPTSSGGLGNIGGVCIGIGYALGF